MSFEKCNVAMAQYNFYMLLAIVADYFFIAFKGTW